MQKHFEAPVLSLIGHADEVVMGVTGGSGDVFLQAGSDFEFEQDNL